MNANFTMMLEPNRIIPASVEDQIGLLPFWIAGQMEKRGVNYGNKLSCVSLCCWFKKKDFIMEESFKEISMEKMLQNI